MPNINPLDDNAPIARRTAAPDTLLDDADDLDDMDGTDDVDVEMALLALSAQDMGEPTEAVDLQSLSEAEKRALLALLRQRLHLQPSPVAAPSEGGGA